MRYQWKWQGFWQVESLIKCKENILKTILVITCSYDHTVDYMISTYQADACFFRLNVDKLQEYSITITDSVWKISYKNIIFT